MPTLQIVDRDKELSTVTVIWDGLVAINHHASDSEDVVEKLKREYPIDDIGRAKVLVDSDLLPAASPDAFDNPEEIIEFTYSPPVINVVGVEFEDEVTV